MAMGGKGNRRNRLRHVDREMPGENDPQRQPPSSTFDRFVQSISSKLEEQHRDRSADEISAISEAVAEGSLGGVSPGHQHQPKNVLSKLPTSYFSTSTAAFREKNH